MALGIFLVHALGLRHVVLALAGNVGPKLLLGELLGLGVRLLELIASSPA